jgi:hypothetical protein
MKILEIITPHETLNEGPKDAIKRFIDKKLVEPVKIFFGDRPPQKVVDELIDSLLAGNNGEQLKRSPEIKQAGSKLVSVIEQSPFRGDDMKKVEALSDSLAEWRVSTGKSIPEGNTLKTLYTLVEEGSAKVPDTYGSKAEFLRDPFITAELSGNVIGGEHRFATDGNVGKYVRTLTDAKTDVYTEANKIKNPKPSGFDKLVGKMADIVKQNKLLKSEFNPLKLDNIKRGFFLFELDKLWQPYLEQMKLANQWHESKKDMPQNVADHFPPVPENLPSGSHVTSKDTLQTYTYSTEDERYECAYHWTVIHLRGALAVQHLTWLAASWSSKVLINKSGTFGKWTWSKVVFNNIAWLQRNPHVDQALKAYMSRMSQYSRLLFVDYLTTASNGSPRSDSLGKQLQNYAVSKGMTPIRNYPEIQNLPEAFAQMSVDSIFDLHNPVNEFMVDVMIDAGIPFTLHYVAIKELAVWAVGAVTPVVIQAIDAVISPADKQVIPGVNDSTRNRTNAPQAKTQDATEKKSDVGADDEAGDNAPPAPPAAAASAATNSKEVKQKPTVKNPADDPDSIYDIKQR